MARQAALRRDEAFLRPPWSGPGGCATPRRGLPSSPLERPLRPVGALLGSLGAGAGRAGDLARPAGFAGGAAACWRCAGGGLRHGADWGVAGGWSRGMGCVAWLPRRDEQRGRSCGCSGGVVACAPADGTPRLVPRARPALLRRESRAARVRKFQQRREG